jgi:hypothetical protein
MAHSAANVYNKQVYLPYQAIAASTEDDYVFGLRVTQKSIGTVVDVDSFRGGGELKAINDMEVRVRDWFKSQQKFVSLFQSAHQIDGMLIKDVSRRPAESSCLPRSACPRHA